MKKIFSVLVVFLALSVYGAEQSVADLSNCVTFPKGQQLCISQTGTSLVVPGDVILEKGGRYYGSNGMSVTTGGTAGSAIYLGDPYEKGGIVIGNGGVAVKGKIAKLPDDNVGYSYPLLTVNGGVFHLDLSERTTGDLGSTSVELPGDLERISNLDPANHGGYKVLVINKDIGGDVDVAQADIFPDHFVARSKSGKTFRFVYIVLATGEGFANARKFKVKTDGNDYAVVDDGNYDVEQLIRPDPKEQ